MSGDVSRGRTIVELIAIVVLCFAGIWLFTPHASAVTITMGQGDIAYLNETVDLSLVAAFPDFDLAWCQDDEAGCTNPLIYEPSKVNIRKVWLDPNYYKAGNYYRWDGNWNRGENAFAMRLVAGIRPVIIDNKTSDEITDGIINTTEKPLHNNTHILIARGDPLVYKYHIPDIYSGQQSYIWMFQTNFASIDSMVLGQPLAYSGEDFAYEWAVSLPLSQSLAEGEYGGYIQYTGDNKKQDILYKPSHKNQDGMTPTLDTIYDDDIIPDVSIYGLTPRIVKEKFEMISMNPYIDDSLYPITMVVEAPDMSFSDYSSDDKGIQISGVTNMAPGTIVTLMLDPDQHYLKQDVASHTWTTTVQGNPSSMREWNATLDVAWEEMSLGTHTIRARINSNGIALETFKDFKVTDLYIIPTPTPERERVVVEEYGWHRITPVATDTPEDEVVVITPEATKFVPINVTTVIVTTAPTSLTTITTNATVQTKPVAPKETIPTIPVEPIVGLAAVAVAAVVMRKRHERN